MSLYNAAALAAKMRRIADARCDNCVHRPIAPCGFCTENCTAFRLSGRADQILGAGMHPILHMASMATKAGVAS